VDSNVVIAIALILALVSGGIMIYFLLPRRQVNMRTLMTSGSAVQSGAVASMRKGGKDLTEEEFERVKEETKAKLRKQRKNVPLNEKFFQAGMFGEEEKRDFARMRVMAPIVISLIMGVAVTSFVGGSLGLLGAALGALLGIQFPFTMLDRRIKSRAEEIMFYLPLVIEQVAIGVSSSLDIGPCLQRVVSMADERDSHNVVTELLKHTQHYIKSGVSLEDAFTEVGRLSGHTELKHAFMSLAQVAKHGGEITRQLQELADAVASQRETKIDAKIKKLELSATGPVALVFMGFLLILMIGFGLQVMKAFAG
jgi:pilus assembly protein TadC